MGLLRNIKRALSKHDCGGTCLHCAGVYIPKETSKRDCNKYAPCHRYTHGMSVEECASRGCCICANGEINKPPRAR